MSQANAGRLLSRALLNACRTAAPQTGDHVLKALPALRHGEKQWVMDSPYRSMNGTRGFASWFKAKGTEGGGSSQPDGTSTASSAEGEAAASTAASQEGTSQQAPGAAEDAAGTEEPRAALSIEELQAMLDQRDGEATLLKKQVEHLTDQFKRTLAEVENVRSRGQREMESTKKFAVQGFAKSLFDVADNLGRALEVVPKEALAEGTTMTAEQLAGQLQGLVGGLSGTEKQLLRALSAAGVEQYNPIGEVFDPNLHMALYQISDPTKEANTIAAVSKRGYMMHGRVVRSAEVGVVKPE